MNTEDDDEASMPTKSSAHGTRYGKMNLSKQTQDVIMKVNNFFQHLADNPDLAKNLQFHQVQKLTAEACGIGISTLQKIKRKADLSEENVEPIFGTPREHYKKKSLEEYENYSKGIEVTPSNAGVVLDNFNKESRQEESPESRTGKNVSVTDEVISSYVGGRGAHRMFTRGRSEIFGAHRKRENSVESKRKRMVLAFQKDDDLEDEAAESQACENTSSDVEVFIKEESLEDKANGSQAYENTSAGVEVFVKQLPPTLDDPKSEACGNSSTAVERTSSDAEKSSEDVGATGNIVKVESKQDEAISSLSNENTSTGVDVVIKEEPVTAGVAEFQASKYCSVDAGGLSLKTEEKSDDFPLTEVFIKVEPETTDSEAEDAIDEEAGVDEDTELNAIWIEEDKYRPEECSHPAISSEPGTLGEPIKTHVGDPIFRCRLCSRKFTQASSLSNHLETHDHDKDFECHLCSKKFMVKSNLNRHVRGHDGGQTFECGFCKKKYNQKNSLTIHLRVHTGEKPFECHLCSRRFVSSSSLHSHLNDHSGVRRYQCEYCEKRFARSYNLKLHLKTHGVYKAKDTQFQSGAT